MDPQGQFASEVGLPFSLQEWAESLGRQVDVLSVSQDLRLRQNAPLLIELLQQTRFFRDLLVIRGPQPYESAVAEFTRILQGQTGWADVRCRVRSSKTFSQIWPTTRHRSNGSTHSHKGSRGYSRRSLPCLLIRANSKWRWICLARFIPCSQTRTSRGALADLCKTSSTPCSISTQALAQS